MSRYARTASRHMLHVRLLPCVAKSEDLIPARPRRMAMVRKWFVTVTIPNKVNLTKIACVISISISFRSNIGLNSKSSLKNVYMIREFNTL